MNNNDIFKTPEAFHAEINKLNAPIEVKESPEGLVASNVGNIGSIGSIHSTPIENVTSIEETETEEKPANEGQKAERSQDFEHDDTYNENNSHIIPKSRFNQEKKKREVAETQLQAERERAIRAEARAEELAKFAQVNKSDQQSLASKEPEIIPLDSEAHDYYQRQINELKNQVKSVAQATAAETQRLYQMSSLQAQEANFAKTNPDYYQAIDYIKQVETNIAREFMADPVQADAFVAQKLQGMAQTAVSSGKNTPEMIYNIAKTYGYKPKSVVNVEETQAKGVNIDAINRNAPRSANINNIGVNSNLGVSNASIEAALANPQNKHSAVDADKFHALIRKVSGQRQ